ncbi:hypothetical protein ON010_g4283 [Phytophthora cinnamomi]|nr:hypothetical protein ON010_g4283 [Phytophthora cinnamomi]
MRRQLSSRPRLYNVKQQIVSSSRFLRVYPYDISGEERGGVPSSVVEKAKSVVTTVSAKKLAAWLHKGKSIDDVFIRLQLAKAGDKLFDNPQFLTWLNYADDMTTRTGKEVSPIATLTAQHGDYALVKVLEAAKKVEATKGTATRLEVEQMQRWLAVAGDDLLISPLLDPWSTYMQIANKENPAKKTTLFATLTAHYSDDALARMIEAAKKVKSKAKYCQTSRGGADTNMAGE